MLTTGVDLVDIPRIERVLHRYGEKFLARVYTPEEVRYSRGRLPELAARFAAKEAVAKALGVGVRVLSPVGVGWREVETLNEASGKPYVILHGRARALAQAQGLTEWAISLSHDGGIAIAFVVAM
ncbi:MAG: holo-ACP synthase [Anaerolineae bacterium]|nr:holo-ACP synthase [Anaerolineae bacterium]